MATGMECLKEQSGALLGLVREELMKKGLWEPYTGMYNKKFPSDWADISPYAVSFVCGHSDGYGFALGKKSWELQQLATIVEVFEALSDSFPESALDRLAIIKENFAT